MSSQISGQNKSQESVEPVVKRKRILLNSDLYDSEASNDAVNTDTAIDKAALANSVGADAEEVENGETDKKLTTCDKFVESGDIVDSGKVFSKEENKCLVRGLSLFSRFYDTISSLDVMETSCSMKNLQNIKSYCGRPTRGCLRPGIENELPNFEIGSELDMISCEECSLEIETRMAGEMLQAGKCVETEIDKLSSSSNSEFKDHFALPVLKDQEHFSTRDYACFR